MQRRTEIDAVRGLMLVWMTLTHLPTIASTFVNQPFGYVSAAEGFVFLSALFTGRIYFRLAERDGYRAMCRRLSWRTVRLYIYHALLLAFSFLVVARIAVHGSRPGLHNLLDFFFAAGPTRSFIDGALLIYRPPLLDILPMYIIFLILTPFALAVARRIGWKPILGVSFAFWLAAQLGFRQWSYNFMHHAFGLSIPLNEMGSFDLWAWQLVWAVGLWCGVHWAKGDLPAEQWARRLAIPAAFIVPVLLAMRYGVGIGVSLGHFLPLFDKWHLGIVRIVDFALISALLIRFQGVLKPLAARPLVLMGQASLQVFCAHLFFCYLGLMMMADAATVTGWQAIALLVGTFAGLLITAKIFAKGETKREVSHPVQVPSMLPQPVPPRGVDLLRTAAARRHAQ